MNFAANSLAQAFKDYGCQLFLNCLLKIHGAKDLVLTESILVQLDSICGMKKLRQNAVDKVFKLQSELKLSETKNRVYVIRPSMDDIKIVAKEINSHLNKDDSSPCDLDVNFWIVFIPSKPFFCDLALEEEGIYDCAKVLECPLSFIPLELDVFSLENEQIFNSIYLNRDITPLNDIVVSILQLQQLSGCIPEIHGQGKYSKIIADRVMRVSVSASYFDDNKKQKVSNDDSTSNPSPVFNLDDSSAGNTNSEKASFTHLFLYDRNCDFGSILLSQLNYEGMLDESFGMCCNRFEFKDTKESNTEPTVIRHNVGYEFDPIYRDIRDCHFTTVFSVVKTRNREMKEKYSKSKSMDLSNLKNFVSNELKKLQLEMKCLAIHMHASEEMSKLFNQKNFSAQLRVEQDLLDGVGISDCIEFVEKCIAHQLDSNIPLRMLSLLSLILGGIPTKDYKRLRTLYCQNFGLSNDLVFDKLSKLNLVTSMDVSLTSIIGGSGTTSSNDSSSTIKSSSSTFFNPSNKYINSFAPITNAMNSLTEAGGKVTAAVTRSVLPKKGILFSTVKKFNLVPPLSNEGVNIRDPADPAFVFGGSYIPLICKLIESTINNNKEHPNNTKAFAEALKVLPKPNFKSRQAFSSSQTEKMSVLVYFVGGVSFAEISALRFLAKKSKIRIAIATSSIINGNRLIRLLKNHEKCP